MFKVIFYCHYRNSVSRLVFFTKLLPNIPALPVLAEDQVHIIHHYNLVPWHIHI